MFVDQICLFAAIRSFFTIICYMFYDHIKEENRQRAAKYDRLENEERTIGDAVEPNGKTVYGKLRSFLVLFTAVFIITTIYVCLINSYNVYLINRVNAIEQELTDLEMCHEIRIDDVVRIPDCVVHGTCSRLCKSNLRFELAETGLKYEIPIIKVDSAKF